MRIEIVGTALCGYGVDICEDGVRYKVLQKSGMFGGALVFSCTKLETIEKVKAKAEALMSQGFSAEYITMNAIG